MEIERKFLLRAVPGGKILELKEVHQGYLCIDPEIHFDSHQYLDAITLRPVSHMSYYATLKSTGLLINDEVQGEISEDFFNTMKVKIDKPFIKNMHYSMSYRGIVIDIYIVDRGRSSSFMYARVKFKSKIEMNDFIWPWPNILIKEVSDNPDFYMRNYWKRTRLE